MSRFRSRRAPAVAAASLSLALTTFSVRADLPPVPFPPENPPTPEKTVLGKILFWDEQLSSDDTVACGTCHRPAQGGGDPRLVRTAGPDGVPNTPDDVFGSPGIVRSNAANDYEPDPVHDLLPQVTGRFSPSFVGAQYFTELFWDGRAPSRFVDPVTGLEAIAAGGALESQSVGPPVSDVEMAHADRDWAEIAAKLEAVRPLHLATDWPADVAAAIAADPSYPDLFAAAFGDGAIDATRIAFAIATYERSLVPDATPWDRFVAGDGTALTPGQRAGLNLFGGRANCAVCHTPPLFSDGLFHNVGLRPPAEDRGRQDVTGNPADRGKMKTPSLRNAGLRRGFFHTGGIPNLNLVVGFYNGGGNFSDNRDPIIVPLGLNQQERNALADFVANGLTDPRVRAELPPFDRPTLAAERAGTNPVVFGAGSPGSGGIVPAIIARTPAHFASPDFKIGLGDGLGGAKALLAIARGRGPAGQVVRGVPVAIDLSPRPRLVKATLGGAGAGEGFATFRRPLPDSPALVGFRFVVQWFVVDAAATGGLASSRGAEYTIF